ncbi:unnamed protein product [Rotaria magnacalcarata]|uniref:F-box domain-containing protein n=1 Tax=Rotaria magnacalcarata TaxID=392030 RepID=A0A8S2KRY6_9BILA|nr:unnamed protein product [Rotaria magnacalcarata]
MSSHETQISKFDILPNEVLLEIFEYLPPVYTFETFYFLNKRYNSLLLSIRLRVDLFNVSKQIFEYYNYFLFPVVSHCVVSLRCEDVFDRLNHHINLSNFISLEYLTITNIKRSTLKNIIPHINRFPNLMYLNLQMSTEAVMTHELYFEQPMPSIEKCILNFNRRLIIEGEQCYSNLKYLTISQYHIDDLLSFLHIYTPELKYLTITFNNEYNPKALLSITENKHNLESLTVKQCRVPFNRIEKLIFASLPRLKRLNIHAMGIDYADGKRWEILLSTCFPLLKTFFLHTTFPEEDASTPALRTQLLKTFETMYFSSHNLHFAFLYHPSASSIDLFSLPLVTHRIHASLYDTHIEKTMSDINIFENVNELSLFLTTSEANLKLPKSCFSNVKNLKLISRFRQYERLPRNLFVDISNLVTFSTLESLEFIGNTFPSTSFVLLDYTPKLESLSISFSNLIQITKALTDQHTCQQLTKLIKHLNITSVNDLKNLAMLERLPLVFCTLESLSLHLVNPKDLYPLMILILQKMARILKRMSLFIDTYTIEANILNEFTAWLIGYLYSHELERVDMTFEASFPDEIILEICRYLHPVDILLSFGKLNNRLNQTISDFIRHVHLSSIISHENYLHLLRFTLPAIWSSIEALTISNCEVPCLTKLFLDNTENNLPPNLKKLCLFHLNTNEIYKFITRSMSNTMIEELIIECSDTDNAKQQELYGFKIAQMLFYHHPTLKSIELSGEIIFDLSHLSFLSLSNSDDSNSMSIMDVGGSSILRRLTIPLQSLSSLHLLLIYQPDLEYLNVHIGDAKSTCDYKITPFSPLVNLREFHLRSDDLSIKFENIFELSSYFPNLKALSLNLTTECRTFFDGIVLQTLVHKLDSFEFSIARFSPPTCEEQTLSTFYTPFWLETKKWYTQSYWNIDEDNADADYFHIYSVPFPFSNFDVYKCSHENVVSNEKLNSFKNVTRLDLSETSDVNIIPFLKRCPNVHTICLNDIYDDEENYGTDEEEDITDQNDENTSINDIQSIPSYQSPLPRLYNVRYIILLALPEQDLNFFERLVHVSPNLARLSVFFDDLLEIIDLPKKTLCQLLQKCIDQLEINLDYSWSTSDVHRDIPKILRIFSNIKSLKITLHSSQKRSSMIIQEILIQLLKHNRNLISITIDGNLLTGFEQILKGGGIDLIKTWLIESNHCRVQYKYYLKNCIHIELNSSSIAILL